MRYRENMKLQDGAKPHKLSRRVPKGWKRREFDLDQVTRERLHTAVEPVMAEGEIVEAAIWFDRTGVWKKLQMLYANGVLVEVKDDCVEEFAATRTFQINLADFQKGAAQ